MPKLLSIVTPCYNEEGNVAAIIEGVREVMATLEGYDYEHVFADNCSTDATLALLKEFAAQDDRIKIIANAANFGPARSVFNALLAARGDGVVLLAADLQDPPSYIASFVKEWEKGYQIVFGLRTNRQEGVVLRNVRKCYYRLLKALTDDNLINDAGDFVLIDKVVVDAMRQVREYNPYIRGLVMSFGFSATGVPYTMEKRRSGKSTANLYSYFVYALNGFVNHTLVPLRLVTLLGIVLSVCSVLFALVQFVSRLILGQVGPPGIPTLIVGLFFLMGINFFILGYIGEYVGTIYKQVKNMPLVIERERINFDAGTE